MGWFLVSIVLPLIAPILGMFVLQRLPLAVSDNDKHFLLPFKDGQLCWGALAFCASAMYEIAVPGEGGSLVVGDMVHWLDSGFIFLLTASALIAAGGAVFPTAIRPVNRHNWYKHYQSMAMSFALTFLAGMGYCVVHFGVFKP